LFPSHDLKGSVVKNRFQQPAGSWNTFLTTDPFSIGGGGGQIIYTGSQAMFTTALGGDSSLWFKYLSLIAPNGSIFDIGDTWEALSNVTVSGGTNQVLTFASAHGLSVGDKVKIPSGAGSEDEYFDVTIIYGANSCRINKSATTVITGASGSERALTVNNGGSVLFTLSNIIASNFGKIQNYGFLTSELALVGCANGFDLTNIQRVAFNYFQWTDGQNVSGGTALSMKGVFDNIAMTTGYAQPNSNESIIYVDPQSTINSAAVTGVSFDNTLGGEWFKTGSIDQTDIYWKYSANSGLQDSRKVGFISIVDNADDTDIGVQNTWYKVSGITSLSSNSERFSMPSNNRLQYDGIEDFVGSATVSFSASRDSVGTPIDTEFSVYKNGIIIENYICDPTLTDDVQVLPLVVPVTASTGDYFELWCRNTTNTNDILVRNMQFTIS